MGNVMSQLRIYENNLKENTDESLKPKLEKQIKDKKEELDNLQKWQSFFSNRTDTSIGLNEEGEVEAKENIVLDTFVGKRIDKTQTLVDGYGEPLDIVETTFDTHDPEVIEIFRQLLNVKNQQAGVDTQISETEMRDVHSKLVDYMKLDKDTKDYMGAVDTLMNPENFKHAIGKMTDGKMKFNVISWLGYFNNVMYNQIAGPDGLMQSLKETVNLNPSDEVILMQEIWNAVYENENYKNLLTVSLDPNLGISNAEYTQKLVDNLTKEMSAKFADIVKKFAPSEYSQDITDEEYDQMIATGVIESVKEQLLIDKIARGDIELGENEQKLINSEQFKESIDAQVAIAKQKISEEQSGTKTFKDPDGKWGVATTNDEIITEGYDTEAEAVAASAAMTNTSEVPVSEIPETTPGQEYVGMSEVELQQKINEINESYDELIHYGTQQEIDDLLQEKNYVLAALNKTIKETPASNAPEPEIPEVSTAEEVVTENPEVLNVPVPAPVISTPAPTPDVTQVTEGNEEGFVSLSEENFMRSLMGLPPVESMEPFIIETNDEQTYDIKDTSNNVLQTVDTEAKAQEIATSANNTRKDIDFVKGLMDEALTDIEDKIDTVMYTSMQSRGERSMKLYNKKNGTEFKTLEEYAATKEGRKSLEAIRESVITGKPIKYTSKKTTVEKPSQEVQINLFDAVETPNVLSTGRNILESLNNELSDFKSIVEEKSKEISKFVDEGTISESSIIEQLKEAAKCFK
jgi:hypothetical protein